VKDAANRIEVIFLPEIVSGGNDVGKRIAGWIRHYEVAVNLSAHTSRQDERRIVPDFACL
jgi:hypothetical protein